MGKGVWKDRAETLVTFNPSAEVDIIDAMLDGNDRYHMCKGGKKEIWLALWGSWKC